MGIKIALAGNPNSGKTTLFNSLTGSNQFVGNWPGVTVEKKEGALKDHDDVIVTDLPGIYSLSPYSLEEVVARNYLINENPDVILNIVDGTNLERNLYLTTQLTELGIPVVVAINMMDIVRKTGDKLDTDALSSALGCKIVEISALKSTGIFDAAEAAIAAAEEKKAILQAKFSESVEKVLFDIEKNALSDIDERSRRWYAVKIFERDEKLLAKLNLDPVVSSEIEKRISAVESLLDDDAESIITNERYNYITDLLSPIYVKKAAEGPTATEKIDRVLTHRFAAIPIFAAIMFLVYFISVTTVGTWVTDFTNEGLFGEGWHFLGMNGTYDEEVETYLSNHEVTFSISEGIATRASEAGASGAEEMLEALTSRDLEMIEEAYGNYGEALAEEGYDLSLHLEPLLEHAPDPADYGAWVPGIGVLAETGLEKIGCWHWLTSLVVDGIIGGVGAVLGFVPQMLVLFFLLSFLEACGYMARIAFVLDRLFRKIGLSGKSFIPLLVGTGCSVPGIMASRTIENERDRRMTVMTTSFIPCGAKLPVIALIASALFGGAWWVAPSAYFVGIAAVALSGLILKKTKRFSGDPAPFVMEMPPYHKPPIKNLLRNTWDRGFSFIKKAGTIILLASVGIWIASSFGVVDGSFTFSTEMPLENSILGFIGSALSWIFWPLGFGNSKAAIATVMGLIAKEEIVGVFGVLDFGGMTRLSAYSFLIFNLLCAPCVAAIGAIRREMNDRKWTLFAIGYQCVFAYVISFIVFRIGSLFVGDFMWWDIPLAIAALALVGVIIYLVVRPYAKKGNENKLLS